MSTPFSCIERTMVSSGKKPPYLPKADCHARTMPFTRFLRRERISCVTASVTFFRSCWGNDLIGRLDLYKHIEDTAYLKYIPLDYNIVSFGLQCRR